MALPRKSESPLNVPACLNEIRKFLNDLHAEHIHMSKPLMEQYLLAHWSCNELILSVDPKLEYIRGGLCDGGLPRRPPSMVRAPRKFAEPCPTGLPRRSPRS
jgi:hypothetical protein